MRVIFTYWNFNNYKNKGMPGSILAILLFLVAIYFMSSTQMCGAEGTAGTTSVNFLKFVSDARSGAMGESSLSIIDNANAVFLNPSRLAYVEWHDLSLSYLSWIEEINYGQIAYAQSFGKKGTLGFGISYLSSGDLEGRDEYDQITGNFKVTDMVASLGYGKNIGSGFSVGGAVKFVREKIKADSGLGFASDIGMTYNRIYKKYPVTTAVNLQHFGWKMGVGEKSPFPTTLRAGISGKLLDEKMVSSLELVYQFDMDLKINVGIEFILTEFLAVRTGYRFMQDDVNGIDALSFGFGTIYPKRLVYLFDYAYSTQGDLGVVHRVNVGVRF